jgi:hypothetical protein
VRIFLWQLARKRLPSNENIRRRRGPTTGACALCGETEDNNHIFFSCPLAKFMWSAVRELLGHSWDPSCLPDIFRLLQNQVGQTRRVFWIASVALLCTLWNLRNKFSIEGVFSNQPDDGLYKMNIYMQVWKPVARSQDRAAVEEAITRIRSLHATTRDQD